MCAGDRRGSSDRDPRRPDAGPPARPDLVEPDGRGDQRPRVDRAGGVGLDGGVQPRGRGQDADRGDVLERQRPGVDVARAARPVRCRRPGRPVRPGPAPRAGRWAALDASITASNGRSGQASRRSRRASKPRRAGEVERRVGRGPSGGPRRRRRGRTSPTSRPIVPGPRTSTRSPGRRSAACTGAQGVAAGLDQRAEHGVDGVGQGVQRRRPGPPAARPAPRRGRRGCRPPAGRSQTCWCPRRQRRQVPSPSIVSPMTRRPTQAGSTPAPTAATTPAHSCPSRIGKCACPWWR